MKKTTLIAGLMALVGVGSLGCKSTPKMAWWKSDKSAESTAVAHSAPALPSDLAKTGAGAATAGAGGEAAPFVAGQVARSAPASATPAGYPSTDAPPFSPETASKIASSTAGAGGAALQPSSANLGSIAATPYDPTKPPRATMPTTGAAAPTPESRYGAPSTTSVPTYSQPATGAVASTAGASTAIPGVPTFDAPAPGYTPTPQATAGTVSQLVNGPASRYGDQAAGAVGGAASRYGDGTGAAANVAASAAGAVQTAPYAVATIAQPYRPGGTGSYPSTISATPSPVQIASRPQTATSGAATASPATTQPSGQPASTTSTPPTPNVATPTLYR